MKMKTTSAFSKAGIAGPNFVSATATHPSELYFGYYYPDTEARPCLTGAFSPQQIIKPSKDVVDVKVYVWFYGPTYPVGELPSPNEKVGWLMALSQMRTGRSKDAGSVYEFITRILADLEPIVVSSDGDGNIDWELNLRSGKVNGEYPYLQFAVAYPECVEDPDVDSGDTGMAMYRTQLKLLRRVGGKLVADDNVTFKEFSANLSDVPVAESLYLWRTVSGGGGALTDPFVDCDGDGSKETDNCTGDVIFLGIEVEIV
jgi:hypothetical protein